MSEPPELRIDTSLVRISGPSSSKSPREDSSGPYLSSNTRQPHYLSAPSNDSNISLISPTPSSAHNSSTSSLNLVTPGTTATSDTTAVNESASSSSKLSDGDSKPEYVLAMHDFEPQHKNATCLAFRAGQVIHVLNRDPSGWWDGELEGKRGWFPSNYVNGDLGLIAQDVMPVQPPLPGQGHTKTKSTTSVSSYMSTLSASRQQSQGTFSRNDYCPPLMVPLLHALSLLQNAVRSNRIAHFQPSIACIISCVRSVLAAAECLSRDAPLLKRHPTLAQERRRVLSELAAIVTQAKKASAEDVDDEDERDAEVEKMVRLGGQVFSRVRRFLAIAVQCGLELPERSPDEEAEEEEAEGRAAFQPSSGTLSDSTTASKTKTKVTKTRRHQSTATTPVSATEEEDTTRPASWRPSQNGASQRTRMRARDRPGTPGSPGSKKLKAKSVGDLRTQRKSMMDSDTEPVPALPVSKIQQLKDMPMPVVSRVGVSEIQINGHKHTFSVSSISSSSSFSSADSTSNPPSVPPFPSGPSSYEQLTEALRHTHDQYLSTIAAFIGHAHSHSRTSHASSTGHMYELVREIVEMVCKLLTIVEAVLRHPGIAPQKMTKLRAAKEGLYSVTSGLAESVRMLTSSVSSSSSPGPGSGSGVQMSEEQEKAALIRSATNALKAGADCSAAVKMCLNRTVGEGPFIIELPKVVVQQGQYQQQRDQRYEGDYSPLNGKAMARVSARFPPNPNRNTNSNLVQSPRPVLQKSASAMSLASPSGDADEEEAERMEMGMRERERERERAEVEDRDPTIHPGHGLPVRMSIETARRFSSRTVTQSTAADPQYPSSPISPTTRSVFTLPSPTDHRPHHAPSLPRTQEEEATGWDEATHERQNSLEAKILNGDLPTIPNATMAMAMPELRQPPPTPSQAQAQAYPDSAPSQSHQSSAGSVTTAHPSLEADLENHVGANANANWMIAHDYSLEDVAYNNEGVLVGATLAALVEKMTPHASIVDPAFSSVFFLTFRLFATPLELTEAIINRYNLLPPSNLMGESVYLWQQQKGIPVRLRVSNFIRMWLETYWRPASDDSVLPVLRDFNRDALAAMFPGPSQRIHETITLRMEHAEASSSSSAFYDPNSLSTPSPRMDRIRDAGMALNPPTPTSALGHSPSEIPRPVMTKTLLSQLRNKSFASIYITDFDSLELARQMTIMECNLYCVISPEEVLESGSGQDKVGARPPVNVRAVSSLSTVITGWVAESILNEADAKKRTALVKFFIKVADRCTTLNNFSTSRSILAALDSSTISRLHQTWAGVPQKQKLQLDSIRKLADHARNYREYRTRLRNTAPPAVPFLGLYLTDVTFCREGNPSHRASPLAADKKLLNFNKYHKMARIVQDMQRFQVPYNLKEIGEVQAYLNQAFENAKHHGDLQDLYRRSLLVEPKMPADTPPPQTGDVTKLFNWTVRDRSGSHPTTSAA